MGEVIVVGLGRPPGKEGDRRRRIEELPIGRLPEDVGGVLGMRAWDPPRLA